MITLDILGGSSEISIFACQNYETESIRNHVAMCVCYFS